MFPGIGVGMGEGQSGLSYSGVLVRSDRERVLAELESHRFTGYLGPQEGAWVVAVAGNPLAAVAARRRRIDDVARDLAATLGAVTLAVEVDRDARLRLWGFDGDDALPRYDSRPADDDAPAELVVDDFGNPVVDDAFGGDPEMVAAALLSTVDAVDDDDVLAELLAEELGEDTSESERLVGVLRALGLPTWIVSSDSLPRRVPGGPDKDDVTRLGAGRTGVQGRVAEALTKRVRPNRRRD